MNYRAYYTSEAWYARRERVRQRAKDRCEFCGVRRMQACHHRTYAHFGHEPLADLMAVCRPCHQAIHGKWSRLTGRLHSLLHQGDTGIGNSALWQAYVETH